MKSIQSMIIIRHPYEPGNKIYEYYRETNQDKFTEFINGSCKAEMELISEEELKSIVENLDEQEGIEDISLFEEV